MTANAYGHSGPWAERPSFDQNGQVASGFAAMEGALGKPRFSPVFYLADLITGYLAAAGMMAALLRRATEGGSYHVRLSLTRSAMLVQELGFLDTAAQQHLPEKDTYPDELMTIDSAYGKVSYLRPPLKIQQSAVAAVDDADALRRRCARMASGVAMQLISIITCPHCAHQAVESMPTDACQFFYDCKECGERLKPKAGDCCVFCSYGSVQCPPMQDGNCACADIKP